MRTVSLSSSLRRGRSSARLRLVAVACGVVALASSCGTSPGTEDEFAELLVREGTITESQAECIAAGVFEEYGADDNAISRLSFKTYDELVEGEDSIEGFDAFYDQLVVGCLS